MKKIFVFAAVIVALAATVSCQKKADNQSGNASVDSLSYAIGHEQAQQTKQRLAMMGIDTAYMDAFIKGFQEGANAVDDKKKQAYNAGVALGLDMMFNHKGLSERLFSDDSTKMLSMKQMIKGYVDALKGKANVMSPEDINTMATRIHAQAFEQNKKDGEKFMAEAAKKSDFKKIDGGVLYKVYRTGNGNVPTDTSLVKLNYEGRTIDGKVFDSSFERKEPITIRPVDFIPGLADALVRMPVGSIWEVYVPQEKAYGERGAGPDIKPYSALIFKVELLGIEKNKSNSSNDEGDIME